MDPSQVVRMGDSVGIRLRPDTCSVARDHGFATRTPNPLSKLRAVTETASAAPETRPPSGRRTIARLWQDAVSAGPERTAYLVEDGSGLARGLVSEADERVRAYANGLLARDVGKGDAFALLARNSLEWALLDFALARVGAVGVPIYASSSAKDVGCPLAHSEAVGVVCEDEEQLAKVEAVSGSCCRLFTFARPPCARRPRSRARRGQSVHARRHVGCGRRGGPVHDHLHVGDDRPAEGVHAQPSQLLRDGERRRPDGDEVLPARRRDAPVPPARTQLRAADAPARRVRRLHDRLPRRPAARRRSASASPPDLLPSVPRVYEKVCTRRAGALRRGDRREETPRRLGAPRRSRGEPSRGRGQACPGRPTGEARACRPPRVRKVRERLGGRLPHAGPRRRPPWHRRSPSSSTRSASASPRVRTDRVHDRGLHTPPTPTASARSGNRSQGSRSRSRRTERSSCAARRSSRGTSRIPEATARVHPGRLAADGRHRPSSTRTASCGSPTGRRTSSSRPAGRTSRRRTSRTTSRRRSTSPRRSWSGTDGRTPRS